MDISLRLDGVGFAGNSLGVTNLDADVNATTSSLRVISGDDIASSNASFGNLDVNDFDGEDFTGTNFSTPSSSVDDNFVYSAGGRDRRLCKCVSILYTPNPFRVVVMCGV
jgi:hypothetical protein